MRAWEIVSAGGVGSLTLNSRQPSSLGPSQVRVRMHANSINYRDLTTIEDPEARKLSYPTVPNSDGAGEVLAVGQGVKQFKPGDRVMGCFFQNWEAGDCSTAAMASALGGALDGVLADEVVLAENGLVAMPEHLSFAEAACLPCAALTAWHALMEPSAVKPGDKVLLLGTGGVSVFAQQFCRLMGVETIVTSSSDAKLARMKELGAGVTINYKKQPEWDAAVLTATGGMGVDRVVEVGGPGTLQRSIRATRVGGQISLIGILTGVAGQITPTDIMRKSILLKGIYVGHRQMFEAMNRAIAASELRPIIDHCVPFESAPDAYRAMRAAGHFGKIVVEI